MLIEILDNNHINGYPHDFISTIKKINDTELEKIKNYWQQNHTNL
jgi:hypothetical protein